MGLTYNLIQTVNVGAGGSASASFTSIPQTYTDLVLKMSVRTDNTGGGNGGNVELNTITTGFTSKVIFGDGASARSISSTSNTITGSINGSTEAASIFSYHELYFADYTSSNYKSIISIYGNEDTSATVPYQGVNGTLWSNTAAISSIVIKPYVGSWVQYSNFYLYGINTY